MKRINLAIIGLGHWGPNFVRIFSQIPEVNLISICDTERGKLMQVKNLYHYNHLKSYTDYKKLLKDKELDAVVISTPASTHYRISKDSLLSNKHVLVEKPIALKVDEAKELIELSKKRKKILMVGHTFLYNPAVRKIKELIKEGELGRIYYIHCRRTNLGPIRRDVNAIWDLAPHDISIINYLLEAQPKEVSCYAQRFLAHKLEDVGFIILKYPKNILVHIHVSWLDPKKIREMTIIGSKKMLVFDDTDLNEPIRIYDKGVMQKKYEKPYYSFDEFQTIIRDGEVTIPKVNMQEPLKIECQHFVDCINNDEASLSDGCNGLENLKILEAIEKSLRLGNISFKIE
ncbi:MAG: Gfo/Idh/MocA family oxidoreductase [Candidatus Omnitrophica bacterium]|nr:Gfo/Idh/MocA family oxidoreductase [Candidatus Omnitrophota bacterium]